MQDYISSLGLKNIELRGFATRPQLMKSMRYCKFVAIPSMYEACPMILLESMCLGKIPLMLRLPFSSELTEGGKYGILGDGVKNLTDRLITLENTYSLSQLSNNIQIFARKAYNMDKVTSKYIELYRNLSSQRGQVND
jgi:glycosyltransferase involved in cell wall biosynthesis